MKQSFCRHSLVYNMLNETFSENLGDKAFFWYALSYLITIKSLGVGDEGYRAYRLDWLLRYNTHWNKEIKHLKFYELWHILNYP